MRITRLYLRNYRVFQDELDLQIPDGLVGIYGPNGGGKSSLVESIRWSMFGKSRTSNDEIRTSGINEDCITEIEFEHEGHLYLVRRTITGANHTVKAEAHWNGKLIAEGVRDVGAYVQSVIGMDDTSFRSSVFAEQKQVAAFSAHTPQKRRDLVLRLLGITPLDKARDTARADARDAQKDFERLQGRLPNLVELEDALAAAEKDAADVAGDVAQAETALMTANDAAEAAEAMLEQLEDVARTYNELVVQGKSAAERIDESKLRLAELTAEQAELADADARLAELRPLAEGIDALEALASAQAAVEAIPALEQPPQPEPGTAELLRTTAEEAASAASELAGALRSAEDELARAEEAAARSAELSADEDCPVCGQSLGDAFEQVVAHRTTEVSAARARVAETKKQLAAAQKRAKSASAEATAATKALAEAQQAWALWEHHLTRRADADAALQQALAHRFFVAFTPPDVAKATKNELATRKQAATEITRIEAKLERAPRVAEELALAQQRLDEATTTREALLEKVKSLAFKPDDLEAKKAERQQARAALKAAAEQADAARRRAASAVAAVETATARLADGKQAHADLSNFAESSRHLGRVADLLHDFRNNVIAVVGPSLAAQAAELFAELTDHEYDRLEVDPDTYEIQIRDAGHTYGMDRFSGSEIDLANLALRVAISEHVRFQSGGAVGLLVLDEVFGPLDDERKERMLLALERLRGRFRQVLVVTHDSAIKEQLPSAIQVEKLPGRRARATVLSGI
jgi:exonuclease SbcC